jgi:HK97 family phage major capsid protein
VEYGARTKAYASTPEAAGGALIFDQFIPDIVDNLLQYGVARRLARIFRTNTDMITRPVKTGIHTAYFPEENATLTASTGVTYSRVQTLVKTSVIYMQMSMQVLDDSNPSLAEDSAKELARAQAYTEDVCLLTAAGEAGYGGMIGAVQRFLNLGITSAAGRVVGGGDWASHTDANIATLMSKLPDYARPNAAFICTPEFSAAVLMRLARGGGGNRYQDLKAGGYVDTYGNRPIITNNIMNTNSSTGTNTIDCLYGDFSRAADFADRLSLSLEVDRSVAFDQYAVAMRGVTRFGINVHDVGDTSRVGPLVYLYQT